jgi:phage shock protein C
MGKVKKLYRPKKDRVISGVCAGLAEYFGVDAVIFRASFALVTIFTGIFPGVSAYLALTLIIPEKGREKK